MVQLSGSMLLCGGGTQYMQSEPTDQILHLIDRWVFHVALDLKVEFWSHLQLQEFDPQPCVVLE